MEYYMYRGDDELVHWGVKGMKWGIRRYQNKDGSLTPAGQKRRAKLEGELEKLGGKKSSNTDSDAAPRKKTVGEMSDDELRAHTTRMQLEKNYYEAQKNLASVNPKQVSRGQKIAEKLLNEAILPSVTNAGKAYLEKTLKTKLGVKEETKINWDDMLKKQNYEKNERDKVYQDLKRQNDINQEKDRAEARKKKKAKDKDDD